MTNKPLSFRMATVDDVSDIYELIGRCCMDLRGKSGKSRGSLPAVDVENLIQQLSEQRSAIALYQHRIVGYVGVSHVHLEDDDWLRMGPICSLAESSLAGISLMKWWKTNYVVQQNYAGLLGYVTNPRVAKLYRYYFSASYREYIRANGEVLDIMYCRF
ncbi:hypothetical protein [Pantoea cypripedii]|uniref:N-acetyltransferase domain-containing protein n=1 Tax=Pantoea cypripedii TaxID=55209 RepID=A0A6B9G581_PANCY|nr:hypothetical protein [Pantoea cypripedii]QGY32704.1 hypothetical protein CUN67_27555 [Pantoea cypripedii]